MTAALNVERLSIRFGGLTAVEEATFEVREGEVLSLIGPNGAGKTSLFNAITGYLRAAGGEVRFRGRRIIGLRPHAIAAMGIVRTFQKTSLFGGESVLDNVMIGLHLRSRQRPIAIVLGLSVVARDEQERRAAAWDILRFMALEAGAGVLAASLPYGEQRLLEVAIALAARPSLLLLDEPVSGMNPAEKARFMGTLAKIRERGITGAPRRARHAHGDGRFRSGHLPQPRPHHRRWLAARDPGARRSDPSLSRREGGTCSRLTACNAGMAGSQQCATSRSSSSGRNSSC
jgi:branched-chain amino acid transport system ATP-binding protein